MANKFKSKQSNKQVDTDLKAISDVLDIAPNNDGKVLYIRDGKIDLEDGKTLFSITPLA